MTTNEFIIKHSFHFAEEIADQQSDFFLGSLDVDSLFTNIPLEETTKICTNELFKESETVEGLSRSEFKEILSLATKDWHFIFDGTFINKLIMFFVMNWLNSLHKVFLFLNFWSHFLCLLRHWQKCLNCHELTEKFAVNNFTLTCSFQFKFCKVTLCYKIKFSC